MSGEMPFAWIERPDGGEPVAIVSADRPAPPQAGKPGEAGPPPTVQGNAAAKASAAGGGTVTIIDGMSGKRQEVAIAGGGGQAPAPAVDQRLIETSRHGTIPKIAADGTSISAAVDVARIELLGGAQGVGTITVGHMEASAQVPAGGINCPVPVTKQVNPDKIHIKAQPDTARVTFNVLNPYDCDLSNVKLTDAIRQKVGDPDFVLVSSDPAADSPPMPTDPLKTADVTWSLGTIKQGEHKVVTMDVKSSENGGVLRDIATANGKLANCKGATVAGLSIGNLALTGITPEVDINIELARTGPSSARTAAAGGVIAAIAAAGAVTLRRRRRT